MSLRRFKDESGIALLVALGLMIVLAIAVTAGISYTTSNTRASTSSQVRVSARHIAEAGMNAAVASIQSDPTNTADLPTSLAAARTMTLGGGTAKYWGNYDGSGMWTLHATGNQLNPSSSQTAVHELVATVNVDPSPLVQQTPPASTNPWAFMWSTRTGNACDETITTQVSTPFIVRGNLCLTAAGAPQTGFTGGPVHVQGSTVTITGASAKSSLTSSYAAIGGGTHLAAGTTCKNSYGSMTAHTCLATIATATPKGDNLAGFDRNVWGSGPITADFDGWYHDASPGPYHGCNPSQSTGSYAALVFENESSSQTRNNSMNSGSVVNLTPATSYDCIVGTKGGSSGYCNTNGTSNSYGELKWDASTKALLVMGTVYIDGSAQINNASLTTMTYSCYGAVYTSGTILVKNTKICAYYLDKTCAGSTSWFSGWWPFANWLFFVADGDGASGGAASQGGLVGSGESIKFINSTMQGGMYATKAVRFDATSGYEGPVIAGNIIFDGNFVNVWGSSGSPTTANSGSTMPSGTPGISQSSKTQIKPPVYTGG